MKIKSKFNKKLNLNLTYGYKRTPQNDRNYQ